MPGEAGKALYDYFASYDACPTEMDLKIGQAFDILDMPDDGWCIVRKPTGGGEHNVPGNYFK